jgi:hypothetical protein
LDKNSIKIQENYKREEIEALLKEIEEIKE